jgi:hypothetical protein
VVVADEGFEFSGVLTRDDQALAWMPDFSRLKRVRDLPPIERGLVLFWAFGRYASI